MERYKEISLADLLALIEQNQIEDVYYQGSHSKGLFKASTEKWELNQFGEVKWFKREVIE